MPMSPQPQRYRVFGRSESFDRAQLRDMIRAGEVTSLTDVTVDGSDQWKTAGMYPELAHYLALASGTHADAPASAPAPRAGASTQTKAMLIAAMLLVIGIVCAMLSGRDLVRGIASKTWPTTEARLTSAEVVRSVTRSRRRTHVHYRLVVSYVYRVDGRTYTSDRVAFGREWLQSPRSELEEIRGANPLLAHYSPSMPNIAVLHTGVTGSTLLIGFAGILALAVGGLLLYRPALVEQGLEKVSKASTIRLGRLSS